jgi:hypothetical protein
MAICQLRLEPLAAGDVKRIIQARLGVDALPETLVSLVTEKRRATLRQKGPCSSFRRAERGRWARWLEGRDALRVKLGLRAQELHELIADLGRGSCCTQWPTSSSSGAPTSPGRPTRIWSSVSG